jgi:hypothetical protein
MAATTTSAKVVSFRLGDVHGSAMDDLRARVDGDLQLEGKVVSFTRDDATGQRLAIVEVPGIRVPVLVAVPSAA